LYRSDFSRFYGLTLWFPEYIRTLRDLQYSSRAQLMPDQVYTNITFNKSLENMIFAGSTFLSCRFEHLTLSHVLFENCTMDGCTFANVRSSRTLFRDTEIMRSHFVDTDLWWGNLPYRVRINFYCASHMKYNMIQIRMANFPFSIVLRIVEIFTISFKPILSFVFLVHQDSKSSAKNKAILVPIQIFS
jgi:hypothetical protein